MTNEVDCGRNEGGRSRRGRFCGNACIALFFRITLCIFFERIYKSGKWEGVLMN